MRGIDNEDGYNYGTSPSHDVGWESFYDLFKPTYDELQTLAPEKPVMIAETASTEDGGSKAAWITDALTVQLLMVTLFTTSSIQFEPQYVLMIAHIAVQTGSSI